MSKAKEKYNDGREIRTISSEHRAQEVDGKKSITGYAILFEHESRVIYDWREGYFVEKIAHGALDEVMSDPNLDVIITPNHQFDKVMGRTLSKTLLLEVDEKGLKYTIPEVPNISYALDMYESIKRGDTFESSFTFWVDESGETWSEKSDGIKLRTITKIRKLKEVSPVTDGAYSNTEVAARSMQKAFPETTDEPIETNHLRQRKLELLKLKRK